MVETKKDYDETLVEAARSVLLEVVHLLSQYHDGIVLVGGWVPDLLIPGDATHHIGSIDVDLALDHRTHRSWLPLHHAALTLTRL